jgi:hypothetical protein
MDQLLFVGNHIFNPKYIKHIECNDNFCTIIQRNTMKPAATHHSIDDKFTFLKKEQEYKDLTNLIKQNRKILNHCTDDDTST